MNNMLEYENELYEEGITLIAGVDEVGRGPLVGPVVVAAVILPKGYYNEYIKDSKKLSEKKREVYNSTLEEWKKELKVKTYENKLS